MMLENVWRKISTTWKSYALQKNKHIFTMASPKRVFVVGVGMTKFMKPGTFDGDYPELAKESVTKALQDARINYEEIEQACAGYVYGDSTSGQRALYEVGMSGIPIYNVNNNCSTGSTALHMAKQLIEGGVANCVLAVGFEKMAKGSLTSKFMDRTNPMDKHVQVLAAARGMTQAPFAAQFFGGAGREHMEKYGTKAEHFAKIAYKNHLHSTRNPNSQFQDEYSLQQIMASPVVYEPLTKLQCCPTSDGSAAAILASEEFVRNHSLEDKAVEILGMEMATDVPSTFEDESCIKVIGFDMTKRAAEKLHQKTNVHPSEANVVELHDCFSTNELITYEALGLCEVGKGKELVESGNNTYGGRYVVNPSGGLISKGHPLGATGIAQCAELCWQLRNEAGDRQVPGARLALQHNIGLGGAVVVALYRRGYPQANVKAKDDVIELPSDMKRLKSATFFEKVLGFKSMAEEALVKNKISGTLKMRVQEDDSDYVAEGVMALSNGKIDIAFDRNAEADCTISILDSVLYNILTRKDTAENAFFLGKLKIQGNLGLVMNMMNLKNFFLSKL